MRIKTADESKYSRDSEERNRTELELEPCLTPENYRAA